MYYVDPAQTLNQKDLENQEKTRRGFLLNENEANAVIDPQIGIVNERSYDDAAIVKDPAK